MTKIPESDAQLLSLLSDAFGPPGFEDEIRQVIAGMVEPLADSIEIDALGKAKDVLNGADYSLLQIAQTHSVRRGLRGSRRFCRAMST